MFVVITDTLRAVLPQYDDWCISACAGVHLQLLTSFISSVLNSSCIWWSWGDSDLNPLQQCCCCRHSFGGGGILSSLESPAQFVSTPFLTTCRRQRLVVCEYDAPLFHFETVGLVLFIG